ncbi:MAG: PilW family protein [Methylococcaceae bacterium]|nr:PilW family protein [Methylococcaceae bacterium]
MKYHSVRASQTGLTMIELMIAMLLGLLLMGGVVQIFVSSKLTFNVQEAQSRVQENGRLAMNFLPYDIRLADFQGCRSRQKYITNVIANTAVVCPTRKNCAPNMDSGFWDLNGGITGSDNVRGATDPVTGLPVVAAGTPASVLSIVAETDIINLQFGSSCGGHLVGNMTASDVAIQIDASNTCQLKQDWPFMISDCHDADIARASSLATSSGIQTVAHGAQNVNNIDVNTSGHLRKAYRVGAEIYSIQSITYFIARNPVGNNALYRRNNATGATEEMVEGVEDMQILYGEDTDNDNTANYYVDASQVVAMQKVVSVKVSLLLRSLSNINITSSPMIYTYNGITYNNGEVPAPLVDHQLRKVFTSTVTLRNRLP